MAVPHFMNDDKSEMRGIKPGWYAMDDDGHLSSGPFSSQEQCLILIEPSPRRHMNTGADCRIHAAEFLAHAKCEPERNVHLIGMAECWLRLAVQAERIDAMMDHARPIIPRNPNMNMS